MSLTFFGPISVEDFTTILSMCQCLSISMCSGASQGQKLLAVLKAELEPEMILKSELGSSARTVCTFNHLILFLQPHADTILTPPHLMRIYINVIRKQKAIEERDRIPITVSILTVFLYVH